MVDVWPVVTEPFTQWVVQRHPAVDLAAWEEAGVEVVDDVAAHEQLKLRVVNGVHSALAYLGLRAGHGTISAALADPPISAFVRRLLADEVLPTVAAPNCTDVVSYADVALGRFANAALGFSTVKVAADGSIKLGQRLIPTARDLLDRGRSVDRHRHGRGGLDVVPLRPARRAARCARSAARHAARRGRRRPRRPSRHRHPPARHRRGVRHDGQRADVRRGGPAPSCGGVVAGRRAAREGCRDEGRGPPPPGLARARRTSATELPRRRGRRR